MTIDQFSQKLDEAIDPEHEKQTAEHEIVARSPDGRLWRINNLVWSDEAEEWQVWIAPA